MSETSINLFRFYCLILYFGLNYSIHTKIGKYWFSEEECGKGRDSHLMDNSCFDMHPSEEQIAMIRWGRPVKAAEFPWFVKLKMSFPHDSFCSSAIINRYWIISAAHCFYGLDAPYQNYVIPVKTKLLNKTLERKYYIQYIFNHPAWNKKDNYMDIAVARLKEPIDFTQTTDKGYRELNAICFPQKYAINTDYELALQVGVGYIVDRKNLSKTSEIWSGWTRMYPFGRGGNTKLDKAGNLVRVRQMVDSNDESASAICHGDSGSPLVQYINGRAVLIGVLSGFISDPGQSDKSDQGCATEYYEAVYARVSRFIDWIEDRIKLGEVWASYGHVQLPPSPTSPPSP